MNTMHGSTRNDRCGVCGEKLKMCKGHASTRRWTVPIVLALVSVLVLIIGIVLMYPHGTNKQEKTQSKSKKASSSYRALLNDYIVRHGEDHWWWHASISMDASLLLPLKAHLEVMAFRANGLVERYRTVSNETERIASAFPLILPSLYSRGISQQVALDPEDFSLEHMERGIELSCIPYEESLGLVIEKELAWYRSEWGAVMIHAVDIPDSMLAGILFHEFWHAVNHREGNRSALALGDSDEYRREEVEAHDIETEVLDAATHGRFSELLKKILERTARNAKIDAVLANVRAEDLVELDALLGTSTSGSMVASTVIGQFTYALLAAHVDRSSLKPKEEKIKLYRWIQQEYR